MDEYQDVVDESEDQYDTSIDSSEAQLDSYEQTFPQAKEKSDLYQWFWKVVKLGKVGQDDKGALRVAKVGYLKDTEIGENIISMRDALNLGYLGEIFHHPKFGEYFQARSMITSATSMSRKGWFMDLSISQKKVRERNRQGMASSTGDKKWRLFKKREPAEGA